MDRDAYGVEFTGAQWQRLTRTFPDGVCDYDKPGVEQQPTVAWATYADGPGAIPLPAAPRSVPFGPERAVSVERFDGPTRIETAVGSGDLLAGWLADGGHVSEATP